MPEVASTPAPFRVPCEFAWSGRINYGSISFITPSNNNFNCKLYLCEHEPTSDFTFRNIVFLSDAISSLVTANQQPRASHKQIHGSNGLA